MLEKIEGLPDGTIGFRAIGKIEAEDYKTVLVPALDEAIGTHEQINFIYVMGDDFDGYSLGAAWQDTRLSSRPFSIWHNIAIVTDNKWMEHFLPLAKIFVHHGEIRPFPMSEEAAAIEWASSGG
jgi:hypothetical protein